MLTLEVTLWGLMVQVQKMTSEREMFESGLQCIFAFPVSEEQPPTQTDWDTGAMSAKEPEVHNGGVRHAVCSRLYRHQDAVSAVRTAGPAAVAARNRV